MASSIFAHYCTTEHHIVFKEKKDKTIVLKVYDLWHRCIKKRLVQLEEIEQVASFSTLPQRSLKEHIIWFIKNGYTPHSDITEIFVSQSESSSQLSLIVLGKKIDRIFLNLRPQILLIGECPSAYICPITSMIMSDPVQDSDGHTFEKVAIETARKIKNICPISQLPIESLTPNRGLKEAIENFKEKSQVPIINGNIIEKPRLSQNAITNGEALEEEKEYSEALASYTKALQYSKSPEIYIYIPQILEKMKEDKPAALCYLHLACQLNHEEDAKKVFELLEKAAVLFPDYPPLLELLALYLEQTGQTEKANSLHQKIDELYWNAFPEEARSYYQEQLEKNPNAPALYEKLIALCPDTVTKSHLYLKAALHFLHSEKNTLAYDFFKKSQASCEHFALITVLPYLNFLLLQGQVNELQEQCMIFAELFEKRASFKETAWCYQTLLSIAEKESQPDPALMIMRYCKLAHCYQQLKKLDLLRNIYVRWINFLTGNKQWEQAEKVAQEALKIIPGDGEIIERLEWIYPSWEGNEYRLADLWLDLGAQYATGHPEKAIEFYEKCHQRFKDLRCIEPLVEIFISQENLQRAVHLCYRALKQALFEGQEELCQNYRNKILSIDPNLSYLSENQKKAFNFYTTYSSRVVDTTAQIAGNQQQIEKSIEEKQKKIDSLEAKSARLEAQINDLRQQMEQQAARIIQLSQASLGSNAPDADLGLSQMPIHSATSMKKNPITSQPRRSPSTPVLDRGIKKPANPTGNRTSKSVGQPVIPSSGNMTTTQSDPSLVPALSGSLSNSIKITKHPIKIMKKIVNGVACYEWSSFSLQKENPSKNSIKGHYLLHHNEKLLLIDKGVIYSFDFSGNLIGNIDLNRWNEKGESFVISDVKIVNDSKELLLLLEPDGKSGECKCLFWKIDSEIFSTINCGIKTKNSSFFLTSNDALWCDSNKIEKINFKEKTVQIEWDNELDDYLAYVNERKKIVAKKVIGYTSKPRGRYFDHYLFLLVKTKIKSESRFNQEEEKNQFFFCVAKNKKLIFFQKYEWSMKGYGCGTDITYVQFLGNCPSTNQFIFQSNDRHNGDKCDTTLLEYNIDGRHFSKKEVIFSGFDAAARTLFVTENFLALDFWHYVEVHTGADFKIAHKQQLETYIIYSQMLKNQDFLIITFEEIKIWRKAKQYAHVDTIAFSISNWIESYDRREIKGKDRYRYFQFAELGDDLLAIYLKEGSQHILVLDLRLGTLVKEINHKEKCTVPLSTKPFHHQDEYFDNFDDEENTQPEYDTRHSIVSDKKGHLAFYCNQLDGQTESTIWKVVRQTG